MIAGAAGVTRRTLYYHFEGKDELVRAYLEGRDRAGRSLFVRARAQHPSPAEAILAVFDSLEAWFRTKEFRGCAFANAIGESSETVVFAGPIARKHKLALRDWFVHVCGDAGAAHPRELAEQLLLLFDGAMNGSSIRRDPRIARHARNAAQTLLAANGIR